MEKLLGIVLCLSLPAPIKLSSAGTLTPNTYRNQPDVQIVPLYEENYNNYENKYFYSEDEHVKPRNFKDDNDKNDKNKSPIFFVDTVELNGVKEHKGVSVLQKGTVKKLLETGTDVATADDQTVYIAATNGLYRYNPVENTAEKYGTIDDSLIAIINVKDADNVYVLAKDNIFYKVTNNGTKLEKVDVKIAKQLVTDYFKRLIEKINTLFLLVKMAQDVEDYL